MSGSVMKIKKERAPLGDVRKGASSRPAATGRLAAVAGSENAKMDSNSSEDITVEEFLEKQCAEIMGDVQAHAKDLIAQLKEEYATGRKQIEKLMVQSTDTSTKLCMHLKVVAGQHMGQKFRLELPAGKNEEVFKVGRSSSKAYKEKGVSLYKDKEVSTAHARIEIRNGEAFYVDMRSTNGSSVNSKMVEVNVPTRLNDGDVLGIGGSEVSVTITTSGADDLEFASV